MSIINDALKKAEQESKKRQDPDMAPALDQHRELKIKIPSGRFDARPSPLGRTKFVLFFVIFVLLIAGTVTVKNLFAPAQKTVSSPEPLGAGGYNIDVPSLLPTDSTPDLALNGIVYDDEKPYAIVNNKVLMKGDEISGAVLIGIEKESVKFSYKDKEFEIRAK